MDEKKTSFQFHPTLLVLRGTTTNESLYGNSTHFFSISEISFCSYLPARLVTLTTPNVDDLNVFSGESPILKKIYFCQKTFNHKCDLV